MSNRAYALLTGAFIIFLGVALAAAAIWLSGKAHEKGRPYIVVSKGSVSGLTTDAQVFFRGVTAGKVDSIEFARRSPHNILIRIEVQDNIPLTQGTYATLQTRALTGSSQIQLNTQGHSHKSLTTNNNHPTKIPMRPSIIQSLSASGKHLMTKLSQMADGLADLLNTQNKAHLQNVFAHTDQATAELVGLEKQIKTSLRAAPGLIRDLHGTLNHVNHLMANLSTLSHSLKAVAKNTGQFTSTGARASKKLLQTTLPKINKALDQLSRTGANIQNFTQGLQNEPQRLLLGPRNRSLGPGEKKDGGS